MGTSTVTVSPGLPFLWLQQQRTDGKDPECSASTRPCHEASAASSLVMASPDVALVLPFPLSCIDRASERSSSSARSVSIVLVTAQPGPAPRRVISLHCAGRKGPLSQPEGSLLR